MHSTDNDLRAALGVTGRGVDDNVLRIPRRQSVDAMHGDRLAEQAGDHPRPFWPADDIGRAERALRTAAATMPGSHRRRAAEAALASPVLTDDRRLGRREGFEDGHREASAEAEHASSISFWLGFGAGVVSGAVIMAAIKGMLPWIA